MKLMSDDRIDTEAGILGNLAWLERVVEAALFQSGLRMEWLRFGQIQIEV